MCYLYYFVLAFTVYRVDSFIYVVYISAYPHFINFIIATDFRLNWLFLILQSAAMEFSFNFKVE